MQKCNPLIDCLVPVWEVGGINSWEGDSSIKFRQFSICGKLFFNARLRNMLISRTSTAVQLWMKLRRKLLSLEADLQQLDGQVTLECRHKEKYLNSPV